MTSQARLSERLAAIFTENRDAEIGQTKGGEEEAWGLLQGIRGEEDYQDEDVAKQR